MSEGWTSFSDADLERALVDLGQRLSYPPTPDLARAVQARLKAHPRRGSSFPALVLRLSVFVPALAVLALLASVLALSPGARSAVASWFHIGGLVITSGTSPPGPLGRNLDLGRRVSLEEAQNGVPFNILTPHLRNLGMPDEAYLGAGPFSGRVSLIYRARPGLPPASTTSAGLLITEVSSHIFVGKSIPPGTTMAPVDIDGEQGVWLTGRPHYVYYFSRQGTVLRDTVRLAGNVLVWEHDGLALRIEGRISEERAIEIARSMEAGTRRS